MLRVLIPVGVSEDRDIRSSLLCLDPQRIEARNAEAVAVAEKDGVPFKLCDDFFRKLRRSPSVIVARDDIGRRDRGRRRIRLLDGFPDHALDLAGPEFQVSGDQNAVQRQLLEERLAEIFDLSVNIRADKIF